jgi:hypothetical protein
MVERQYVVGLPQGAGTRELLAAFDMVRMDHERMDAEEFNDDGTYKAGINQVGARSQREQ